MYRVSAFVEKPDPATARRYYRSKRYYWNAGIFIWRVGDILGEIKRHLPGLYQQVEMIGKSQGTPEEGEAIRQAYDRMKPVSIDYGVVEKADKVAMVEANMGWTDLGSWSALEEVLKPDRRGNIRSGNIVDLDSRNSVIYASQRLVATIGLDHMIVVDSPDATLVCPKDRAQDVKQLVAELKRRKVPEHSIHQTVERPWGSYTVLEEGKGYKVKRIVVRPGRRLSLQLHKQRSEHWVVVAGTARVTRGEEVYEVRAHESTYIPVGTAHRIENPGAQPLEIIEVQNGSYLGEDDIIRLADDFGRTGVSR